LDGLTSLINSPAKTVRKVICCAAFNHISEYVGPRTLVEVEFGRVAANGLTAFVKSGSMGTRKSSADPTEYRRTFVGLN